MAWHSPAGRPPRCIEVPDSSLIYRASVLAPESLFPRAAEVPPNQLAVMNKGDRPARRGTGYSLGRTYSIIWTPMADSPESLKERGMGARRPLAERSAGRHCLRSLLDEIWQEFHPAIRRLLFQHYYPSPGRARVRASGSPGVYGRVGSRPVTQGTVGGPDRRAMAYRVGAAAGRSSQPPRASAHGR